MPNRSYLVILTNSQGRASVVTKSAKEASETAAKATHDGYKVTIEDEDGNSVSEDSLANLVRTSQ